ncbi:MAG: hypothetical protein EZS28_046871, partial [Streblomastix strix]
LNLASLDSIHATELQPLRSAEAITQQLWHFFVASPLHAAILEDIHKLIQDRQVKPK